MLGCSPNFQSSVELRMLGDLPNFCTYLPTELFWVHLRMLGYSPNFKEMQKVG